MLLATSAPEGEADEIGVKADVGLECRLLGDNRTCGRIVCYKNRMPEGGEKQKPRSNAVETISESGLRNFGFALPGWDPRTLMPPRGVRPMPRAGPAHRDTALAGDLSHRPTTGPPVT